MSGRNMMGDAWKIKEENFPEMGEIEEKMRFLLNYAILAPSSHNTQPWKFSIKGNNIEVYADFTKQLPRRELQNLLKMAELPQLLFRIGYAKAKAKTKHTPRRRLEEVVV